MGVLLREILRIHRLAVVRPGDARTGLGLEPQPRAQSGGDVVHEMVLGSAVQRLHGLVCERGPPPGLLACTAVGLSLPRGVLGLLPSVERPVVPGVLDAVGGRFTRTVPRTRPRKVARGMLGLRVSSICSRRAVIRFVRVTRTGFTPRSRGFLRECLRRRVRGVSTDSSIFCSACFFFPLFHHLAPGGEFFFSWAEASMKEKDHPPVRCPPKRF